MDRLEHLPDIEAEESVDDLLEGLCMVRRSVSDEDEVAEMQISNRGGESQWVALGGQMGSRGRKRRQTYASP